MFERSPFAPLDAHVHATALPRPLSALRAAQNFGLGALLCVTNGTLDHQRLTRLCDAWSGGLQLYCGLGLHPEADPPSDEAWQGWAAYLAHHRKAINAIGEVGLPSYREVAPQQWNRWLVVLERLRQTAEAHQLPLVVHAVHRAAAPALEVLKGAEVPVLYHWLKAPVETVDAIVNSGAFVSVTPEVRLKERDQALLARIPDDQLLAETDSPWPHSPHDAGSTPKDVLDVYRYLDVARPGRDWRRQLAVNFLRFLRCPASGCNL